MDSARLTTSECKQWIKDLRSGKYKQCRFRLKAVNQYGSYFCCLGVLKETQGKPQLFDRSVQLLDTEVLPEDVQYILTCMNDSRTPFSEIANHIEEEVLPKLKE